MEGRESARKIGASCGERRWTRYIAGNFADERGASEVRSPPSAAIEMKPGFAEAWNNAATLYFLMGRREVPADCDSD